MKIRNDFVSNSSSSSFIIGWKGKLSDALKKVNDLTYNEKKDLIEITKQEMILNKKNIIIKFIDEIYYDVMDKIIKKHFNINHIWNVPYQKVEDFEKTDEFYDMYWTEIIKELDSLNNKINNLEHFSYFNIEDTNSLECSLYNSEITIKSFSQH